MPSLYTTHEVARIAQVDPSTVAKWMSKGELVGYRTPGGHRRVRGSDLRAFLIANHLQVPRELDREVLRIMAVDDELPVLEGLRRSFRELGDGVDFRFTTSGVEALLLMAEAQPHVLLIDLNMPELDGFEVCRRVSGRPQFNDVLLVAMTSLKTAALEAEAIASGATCCLQKPVEPQQLVKLVAQAQAVPQAAVGAAP